MAALAVPLVGASAAPAAMGGANPLTTTDRPDLRSVTLTSANTARFCFNKNVSEVVNQSGFILGGYRFDDTIASSAAPTPASGGLCVDATFNTLAGQNSDLTQHTFGQVSENAVRRVVGAGFRGNRWDSTALAGSVSKNGTRGLSTAPDLQSVEINNASGPNDLLYKYDQQVDITTVAAGSFFYYRADGVRVLGGTGAVVSGNNVLVSFPNGPPPGDQTAAAAVRAGHLEAAVSSRKSNSTPSSRENIPVAGKGTGNTTRPDLISAQLGTDGTFVDFTFDRPVSGAPAPVLANFRVILADGASITANGTLPSGSTNTVRATFANSNTYHEYLVKAVVDVNAEQDTGPNPPLPLTPGSSDGSVPIGGNAGAFSSGFSTGPDALRVNFDALNSTATVLFDSRAFCPTFGQAFILLDANGESLGTGNSASCTTTGATTAGPFQVTVDFLGSDFGAARALEMEGPGKVAAGLAAVTSSGLKPAPGGGVNFVPNIQQIASPIAVSTLATKNGKPVFTRAKKVSRAKAADRRERALARTQKKSKWVGKAAR